jgi:DNA-binding GntR family transcriptional regulator
MAPDTSQQRDGHVAQVHDGLRNMILRGEIAPGTTSSQVQLAEMLGVGRTPLREALRLLQSEGLIVTEPNRRVRIADFSLADVEDLYFMRIALECSAVIVTVPELTSVDVAELEGLMAQMEHFTEVADALGWEGPHRSFHMKLTSGAGTRTRQTLEQLWDHAERYRHFYTVGAEPPPWLLRAGEHRRILDAAKRGDAEAAAEALGEHYAGSVAEIVERAGSEPTLPRLAAVVGRFAPGGPSAALSSS